MRAELGLMGKSPQLASRSRRRWLVDLIYALFAVCLIASWLIDRWSLSSVISILVVLLPSFWILRLTTKPQAGYLPDERELRWRDRAHFYAYRAVVILIVVVFTNVMAQRDRFLQHRAYLKFLQHEIPLHAWNPQLLQPLCPSHAEDFLWGAVVVTLFIASTLPESLILWFAPDMEEPNAS
jgi:hypothetical protein